jgi:hypothetical protein
MLCVAFAWFGVGVIALYRCGAVLVAERRYKLKVCSIPPDGLGTSKRFPWELLDKHDSVTETELAVAALRRDAGDDRSAAVLSALTPQTVRTVIDWLPGSAHDSALVLLVLGPSSD